MPAVEEIDAPALVLYTSGSTGRAKGAVLSHAAVSPATTRGRTRHGVTAEDRVLAVLPLSHSYGINGALLAPLLAGACVVIVERFRPRLSSPPSVSTPSRCSPRAAMYSACSTRRAGGATTSRACASRSPRAPCPWPLAEAWRERSGVRILRGYG